MARGGAAAFINGLIQGYEQGRKMYKDYELGQVMNAKPEEVTGYTAQDGEQLKAMSEAKDADGKPYYTIGNDDKGNYTVTPNFGEDPKLVVMQQGTRTSFLGQDYDGTLTPEKMAVIRNSKMADVLAKYDPLQAEAIRRGNKQAELMDIQIKGAERQDRIAQREEDKASLMDRIKSSVSDFARGIIKTDANGQAIAPTGDDMFEINKHLAGAFMQNGLPEEAMAAYGKAMSDYANVLELTKKQRQSDIESASALAGAGQYGAAMQVYGKYLKDGFNAVDAVENKDGSIVFRRVDENGKEATPLRFESREQLLAGLQSMVDSKFLLSEAQRKFDNDLKSRSAANSEKQTAISAGRLGVEQQSLGEQIKGNQFNRFRQLENDGARKDAADFYSAGDMTAAQRAAIRGGINLPSPAPKWMGTDIKVDQMGNIVAEQKQPDGSARVSTFTPEGKQRGSINIPAPGAAGGVGATPKNITPEDIAATAKKYNITEDEVKRRLNIK